MTHADIERLGFVTKAQPLVSSQSKTWSAIILISCIVGAIVICLIAGCREPVWAAEIDLGIIAQIESSNDPLAYNKSSGAVGMYQITPVCLMDYNELIKDRFELSEMFDEHKAFIVANWYLNKRIPRLLKHFKLADTTENRLRAYNSGIGTLFKGMYPAETRNYVKKYQQLARLR